MLLLGVVFGVDVVCGIGGVGVVICCVGLDC